MGGYGAMRAILSTDIYSKGASFSGALDVFKLQSSVYDKRKGPFKTLFSDKFKKEDDLYHLLTLQKDKDISLYVSCGTEDVLLPQKKIKHVYYEKPGNHTWDFWDQEIKEALKFFLEK